jgi:hypothetical protein
MTDVGHFLSYSKVYYSTHMSQWHVSLRGSKRETHLLG